MSDEEIVNTTNKSPFLNEKILMPVLVIIVTGILAFIGSSSILALVNSSKLTDIKGTLGTLSSQLTGIQADLNDLKDPRVHDIELDIERIQTKVDIIFEEVNNSE